MAGLVEPVETFLSSSLITLQNLVAACHTVSCRSQKFGDAGTPPLRMRAWLTP